MNKYDNLLSLGGSFYKLAIPLESEQFENLHEKELKDLLGNRKVVVYHGTSTDKLAKILAHGSLDPDMSGQNKTFYNSSPGIFVTKQFGGFGGAEFYANNQSHKGDPVVLEIVIPINWIEQDPDDTKYDQDGKINQYGKNQGVVRRPISTKNIKRIEVNDGKLNSFIRTRGGLGFDANKSEFIPIGLFLDKVKKALDKGIELPDYYIDMVGNKKGLSKSEPSIDREQILATGLTNMYDNLYRPDDSTYSIALKTILKNKFNLWSDAASVLNKFFEQLGKPTDELIEWHPYNHKETIQQYFARNGF